MNKIVLMGRLTKNPNVSYINGNDGQKAVARFTLAVDKKVKNADGTRGADFISCVCFAKVGEFAEKYLSQGIKIVLDGHIQTGNYVNKDGVKIYTTDVIVENIEFAEKKQTSDRPVPNMQVDTEDDFMNVNEEFSDNGFPFS